MKYKKSASLVLPLFGLTEKYWVTSQLPQNIFLTLENQIFKVIDMNIVVIESPQILKVDGFELHGRSGNYETNGDWEIGLTDNTNEPPESQKDFAWSNGSSTPFNFTVTPELDASFSIGGASHSYGDSFDFSPNAIFIWAKSITDGSVVLDNLEFNGQSIDETVVGGSFNEILIADLEKTDVDKGITLTGNVTMNFNKDNAPEHSRIQFHLIPSVIPVEVNSTGNSPDTNPGDGIVYTGNLNSEGEPEYTLRAAIEEFNALAGRQEITFDIPESDPGFSDGVFTIQDSDLPEITEALSILGETQEGFAGENPIIFLSGSGTALSSTTADVEFSTLGFENFDKAIVVDGSSGTGSIHDSVFENYNNAVELNLSGSADFSLENNSFTNTGGSGASNLSLSDTANTEANNGNGDDNGDDDNAITINADGIVTVKVKKDVIKSENGVVLQIGGNATLELDELVSDTTKSAISGDIGANAELKISGSTSTGTNSSAAYNLFARASAKLNFSDNTIEGGQGDGIDIEAEIGGSGEWDFKNLEILGVGGIGLNLRGTVSGSLKHTSENTNVTGSGKIGAQVNWTGGGLITVKKNILNPP